MPAHPLLREHHIGSYTVLPEGADEEGRYYWSVVADLHDPEEGGTVHYSASLAFALNEGAFSDPWERPIPPSIMERLERLTTRLEEAGLF